MYRSFVFALFLALFTTLLAGCSGSGSSSSADGTGPIVPPPSTQTPTSTVVFDFTLASKAVPATVTDIRFTGRDASGVAVYGPVTRPKAARIVLSDVPVNVVRIDLEYLSGDTVVAVGAATVSLSVGQSVTVRDPDFVETTQLRSLSIAPANPSVLAGGQQQFTATATFNDGTTRDVSSAVTWASSSAATATISSSGLATAIAAGTTAISATLNSVVASTQLTVTASGAALTSIAVTPANPTVPAGITQQFTASGTFSDGSTQDITSTVAWSSGDPAVATISASGLATSQAAGPTTITATQGGVSGSTTLTVTAAALVSIAVTPPGPLSACGVQQFTATGTFSDSSTQDITGSVTWSSSNTSALTIVANSGLATTLIAGTSNVVATQGAVSGQATITVNPLSGTFGAPTALDAGAGSTPRDVAVGDLNGDNIPDIVNVNRTVADPGPDVQVWRGVGDGTFTGPTAIDLPGNGYQGCALVDFNNDNVLDLFVTQQGNDTVGWLAGTGAGSFDLMTFTTAATGAGSSPNRVVVGHFDAGTVPDVAVSLSGTNQVAILLGNGSGFAAPTPFATAASPWGLAVGDFNGDNVEDIVTACVSDGTLAYNQGVGDGTFMAATLVAPLNAIPACDGVCVADFNGDQKMDLGVAGQASDGRVFTGNGDGTFTAGATISGINGQNAFWVTAGDLNCDGFQDLVFGLINGSAGIRTVLGNGDGSFQNAVTVATAANASVVVIHNMNTTVDGKPDIVVDCQADTIDVLLGQ